MVCRVGLFRPRGIRGCTAAATAGLAVAVVITELSRPPLDPGHAACSYECALDMHANTQAIVHWQLHAARLRTSRQSGKAF